LAARGQAAAALEAARAATQADPQAAEAQAALGLAALAQDPEDKKGEAVGAAQQASFLEPKNPLPKLALGRVFESRGQLDQARTAYGEAAALDPTWPAPRIGVLGVRLRQGDTDGALAALRALPEEFRTTGEAELLLGRVLMQKEQWAGAVAALDRAAALLPGLAEVPALLGDAAYDAGELKRAADATAVPWVDPRTWPAGHYACTSAHDGRRERRSRLLEIKQSRRRPRPGWPGGSTDFEPSRREAAGTKALARPKNSRARWWGYCRPAMGPSQAYGRLGGSPGSPGRPCSARPGATT
jgi:Flp pilus assembly protein TadD